MSRRLFLGLLFLCAVGAGCRQAGDAPAVLFLLPGPNGAHQLFRLPAGSAAPRQLTGGDDPAAPEVYDYAPAPGGERVAYAVLEDSGDTAIRIVDDDGSGDTLLLDCPQAECSGIVWSPDGRRVVYERRARARGLLESPRLFWLDPATGETLPLIEGNETPGYGARFSPDGRRLSYVSIADDGIVLYNLDDGRQRLLSSRVGSPAAFSPDSAAVVYGDLVVQGHETAPDTGEEVIETPVQESSNVFLYRSLVDDDSPRELLSPDAAVADTVPAFSPDGEWIAFGRAPANTTAGRQLWLMRLDGSDARPLTSDPAYTHGPPNWSPDGRALLFQRYDPSAMVTSVWRLDVETGEATLLADGAYLPAWGR